MELSSKGPADKAADDRMEFGRVITAAMVAAAFAVVATIVGSELKGEAVRIATYCMVVAIPVCTMHLMVTAPGQRELHHISRLMRFLIVPAAFSFIVGLSAFIEHAVAGAGWIFGILSLLIAIVIAQANDRGTARLRARSTT